MASENVSDSLEHFVVPCEGGHGQRLAIPEGAYRGWVPRVLYSMNVHELKLPFLRLLSFPVGGTAIGSLATNLTIFEAVGNYLGKLPASFADCANLVQLDLGFNYFGEVPLPVFKLRNLRILNLEHNDIVKVDSGIGQLKQLTELNLNGNLLSSLPIELRYCKRLRKLYLSGKFYPRGMIKEFPECICHLRDLIVLNLSWQQIRNIPDSFGNLRNLEELNLKWNQLQEVSPEMVKCHKLVVVDFSGALRLLSAIPEPLFSLEDLSSLNLSDNFFTDIPREVHGLRKLRHLVVQRNSLLRLSPDLFQLRYLEHLELGENFLEDIPLGIRNLRKLQYLGLGNNRLTVLRDEMCRLEQLTHLYLGNNKLSKLPEEIYRLDQLVTLDLDNNQLMELPLLMDRLEGLAGCDGLHVVNNPLRSPFFEMSQQGTQELFEFLKGLRVKEAHHRWKMILIGAAKAGKTSLRQALMLGRSKLTAENERTWVMERHLWEPESRLRVQILDFGGHHIYQAAHHMFLSSDALHVLVFDLTKYNTENYEELIGHWLEAITDRAAGATIVVVGTHCDLCTKEDIDERTEDILRLMHRDEGAKRRQIEQEIERIQEELDRPEARAVSGKIPEIGVGRLQEKLNRLQRMLNSRSKLPEHIFVVSCADRLDGVGEFRDSLVQQLKSVPITALPDHWFSFLEQLQQVTARIISLDQAMEMFQTVMTSSHQSMMGMRGSPQLSLEMVLKYLHSTGEILWYHDNDDLRGTVFHRPEALIDMLRAVFRHDFDQVVVYSEDTGSSVSLRQAQFDKMKKDFLKKGLLTKELLRYLLIHFDLSSDAPSALLSLILSVMLKFGLCFELTNSTASALIGSSSVVQFPWFFPEELPESMESKWPASLPPNTFEICIELVFSRQAPPNFFEKLSVKLQNLLSDTERINWRDGVLAVRNLSSLLVTREKKNGGTVVTVAARSASDLQDLWGMVLSVRRAAMSLFKDWPLVKCDISLVCLHCVLRGVDEPYRFPGHVLEHTIPKGLYSMKCCEKMPDEVVPTAFVFPLDESSYQENHQEYMRAATEFMLKSLMVDTVDGPRGASVSVLSDGGLAFIAANLGFNWSAVILRLGIPQARIEQLIMTYQYDVYQQILHALLEWRGADSNDNNSQDKIDLLFGVLREDDIGRTDLVDQLSEDYSTVSDSV
ncbi:malignant fibrous histiocytoma-amplified sequence 1 homolog [Aplysia californica]|uniref:Malignant fibrous histiocytoma-amplified sequence 1 homolog n=1 Tax=Aplysia californica TaxID=6500 RepID=A0ABM1W3Q0_APLCA|nr:malignant fibrous histiocytoma-amplified sequence 1 homolog [Aplysia californica]XP_035829293.1 malignant fibrous histiocytoma-amplified sequence 1 homolog [Aplysia californica]XP_035829294.1 malignant fibrous histiocytoma-amplified sequence 1 homolog [Aplysia californica]